MRNKYRLIISLCYKKVVMITHRPVQAWRIFLMRFALMEIDALMGEII